MQNFPSADHLTSWVGVAPGNNESAGKVKNTGIRKGYKYMRVALVTVAWSAIRAKVSYSGENAEEFTIYFIELFLEEFMVLLFA